MKKFDSKNPGDFMLAFICANQEATAKGALKVKIDNYLKSYFEWFDGPGINAD